MRNRGLPIDVQITARFVQFSSGIPVVQGELQKLGTDLSAHCMACSEPFEFPQPMLELLISKVGIESPVIRCPRCNCSHLMADGQKALIMGPFDGPRPERPKGLVLARCVMAEDLMPGIKDAPELKVSAGDTAILTPGDYLAVGGPPMKPIRVPGKAGFCCTCTAATEHHCPDCQRHLCLKTGCEAAHAIPCPPKKRDLYV